MSSEAPADRSYPQAKGGVSEYRRVLGLLDLRPPSLEDYEKEVSVV